MTEPPLPMIYPADWLGHNNFIEASLFASIDKFSTPVMAAAAAFLLAFITGKDKLASEPIEVFGACVSAETSSLSNGLFLESSTVSVIFLYQSFG
jgi:hypothetical protein